MTISSIFSFVTLASTFFSPLLTAKTIKVACVGDSITYGSTISNRNHFSYPAQLQNLLGNSYLVKNFGVPGSTMLTRGNNPWVKTITAKQTDQFHPDIVVIKLGTNDSKARNWKFKTEFQSDTINLINHFKSLPGKPRIILCTPIPSTLPDNPKDPNAITKKSIQQTLPLIRNAAKKTDVELIDLYTEFSFFEKELKTILPDGVHPHAKGATHIALRVADQILLSHQPPIDIKSKLKSLNISPHKENFNGFSQYSFSYPKAHASSCIIVAPQKAIKGAPWIWRARFFGHQPDLDLALLNRGYYLAYCDVSNLYGAPKAVARWNQFYTLTQQLGLSKKPILEGMSRGGLIIFNWAKNNPHLVAAIYGDNPVCDIRSWPFKKSKADWERCKTIWNLKESNIATFNQNPIDSLSPLAKAKVPVFLVLGAKDKTVPPKDNALLLSKRYQTLHGSLVIWQKPNNAHHPHGLHPVFPLLRHLLYATGNPLSPQLYQRSQTQIYPPINKKNFQHSTPISISGIYPNLAMFNNENECGTGAIVPWANRLWVVTYAPHAPRGSSDKLYEITPTLKQIIRKESIGGTPANRMIHKESHQLFIGPYVIDAKRNVRTIPYSKMFGRLTANARSLNNPASKILYATMEEGIYEVDVKTLNVTELWADEQVKNNNRKANLPGYHGKGFYSGQGVYVYANNGEHGSLAQQRPDIPSGVLAEWDGKSDAWKVIRRNQFTEITGPYGIYGAKNSATDPIWAVGWDDKSLLLGVRMPNYGWSFYRLPKGSHSYDGAHGWNTEWPRIRKIEKNFFLMTMHGTFWKFPSTFSPQNSTGIFPRSNYLKVIGDFCNWKGQIVCGCDDTARAEFLNKRKAKGEIAAPQSQSNLWFLNPDQLDHLGPVIGHGAVWLNDTVKANTPSDPYLFSGYDIRGLHLHNDSDQSVTIQLELDKKGNNQWTTFKTIKVPAKTYLFTAFSPQDTGTWIRLKTNKDTPKLSAVFSYRNKDTRSQVANVIFKGIAKGNDALTGGIVRSRDHNKRTLSFASVDKNGKDIGYYELNAKLQLKKVDDATIQSFTKTKAAIATGALIVDDASAIYIDESGKHWRLPKGNGKKHPLGSHRIAREVATERDLLNAYGTFYELPARNAGGISKLRAISTHNSQIHDFCSYRGMLVFSGISTKADTKNPHIILSDDKKTALWVGAIDDIWNFGKPRGNGGPWKNSTVKANTPSDPYIMTGFDQKSLTLSANANCKITAQVDIHGNDHWVDYKTFKVSAGKELFYNFPKEFQAYWIRFVSNKDNKNVFAQLSYK